MRSRIVVEPGSCVVMFPFVPYETAQIVEESSRNTVETHRRGLRAYTVVVPSNSLVRGTLDDAAARLAGAVKTWIAGIHLYPTPLASHRQEVFQFLHSSAVRWPDTSLALQ
jgi:hypothetical protein